MSNEKIMTLHPQGRAGANLSKAKYEAVRTAILQVIGERGEIEFRDLDGAVSAHLGHFDGAIGWYTTNVKLDLEARGLIERIPGSVPQRLRMKRK